jgi:hypothetical protein
MFLHLVLFLLNLLGLFFFFGFGFICFISVWFRVICFNLCLLTLFYQTQQPNHNFTEEVEMETTVATAESITELKYKKLPGGGT